MNFLDNIEALAKEATPGPWFWDCDGLWREGDGKPYRKAATILCPTYEYDTGPAIDCKEPDAAFIAAANPAAVLAMAKVCRAAKEHMAATLAYRGTFTCIPSSPAECRAKGEAVHKTEIALRSAIEALDAMQKEEAKG
jgi:hypothetical protein